MEWSHMGDKSFPSGGDRGHIVPAKLGDMERLKEVTLNPVVYEWTFERRVTAIEEFLRAGHDVKVVIRPEPRQGSASEASLRLLDRITARVVPDAATEESREREGTTWVMVLSPAS
jgi:translation initiation factor IF-3